MVTKRVPSERSTQAATSGRARKSGTGGAAKAKARGSDGPKAGDLVAAVGKGRREGLEALRDDLAATMVAASVGVKAQIAGQLRAVLADLDGLAAPKGSVVDEIARKREERRAKAKVAASAAGKGK